MCTSPRRALLRPVEDIRSGAAANPVLIFELKNDRASWHRQGARRTAHGVCVLNELGDAASQTIRRAPMASYAPRGYRYTSSNGYG